MSPWIPRQRMSRNSQIAPQETPGKESPRALSAESLLPAADPLGRAVAAVFGHSQGKISLIGDAYDLQRALLQSEGIEFGPQDSIDLAKYA